jgi:hypothetical protein
MIDYKCILSPVSIRKLAYHASNMYMKFLNIQRNGNSDVKTIAYVWKFIHLVGGRWRVREPRSGQTKDFIFLFLFIESALHKRERTKTDCFGIRIACPSGVTCIPIDCCFCELAL